MVLETSTTSTFLSTNSHLENMLQSQFIDAASTSAGSSSTPSPNHTEDDSDNQQQQIIENVKAGEEGQQQLQPQMPLDLMSLVMGGNVGGDLDFSKILQALNPQSTSSMLSSLFSNNSPSLKPEKPEKVYKPRATRMKVYADGFFMTFDKESSCGLKNFWRCERKNECPARMHTKVNELTILKRIHPHNHPMPSAAELAFYNLNLDEVVADQVLPVNAISRSMFKCRRLSRMLHESPQDQSLVIPNIPSPGNSISAENQAIIAQLNSRPIKRELSEDSDERASSPKRQKISEIEQFVMNTPNFMEIFEISKKLFGFMNQSLLNKKLLVYVANGDEDVYQPIELETKTERCLVKHLETLTSETCSKHVHLVVSSSINVVIHDSLISSWTPGKYFKLRTGNSWKLEPVNI
ncbi:unnamed protein product [Caenorhabditis angaria]|uniref:FLYWCH-type domain-containing protein n=1 Tax=Caenorhabditis angaria TaxID=860376 RepID=A0A9P1IIT0_9PELO|nr:unnamed protein product [Caenorhabditis angaria]